MSKINSINNKSSELTIDPGTGDSFIQYSINTTGKFRIGTDETDDSFRISIGSALGTNDALKITSAGEVTKPLQPAFLAKRNSTLSNVTGDNTNYAPIIFDSEIYDLNGDYNNSTGYFTAPVSGIYMFMAGLYVTGLTSSHTRGTVYIAATPRQFYVNDMNYAAAMDSSNGLITSGCGILQLSATNTVRVGLLVRNGTKVVDIYGDATADCFSYFCGYLIG